MPNGIKNPLLADREALLLEVDVSPCEAEGFAEAHPCVLEQENRQVEARVRRKGFEELLQFLRRHDDALDVMAAVRLRRFQVATGILADELARVYGVAERRAEDRLCVVDRPLCQASIAQGEQPAV